MSWRRRTRTRGGLSLSSGIVAFSEPKHYEEEGWKFVSFTGYFEDINEVKVFEETAPATDETGEGTAKERTVKSDFEWKAIEGGYRLTARSCVSAEQKKQVGEIPPEAEQMMGSMLAGMMEGFEMSETVVMPGPVKKAEGGMKMDGRNAVYRMTADDFKGIESMKQMAKDRTFTIESGPSAVTREDIAAFRAEMAEAKAKWEEKKAKAAAEAEEESAGEEE